MRAVVASVRVVRLALALGVLGAISLAFNAVAAVARPLLPPRVAHRVGRRGIAFAYRAFLRLAEAAGLVRLDLRALDALRGQGPLVLVANHPSMLDAVLVVSRLPVVCLMKPQILANPFLGAGARLAGYVSNDPPRRLVRESVRELALGQQVLVFPEGTRSPGRALGPFRRGAALIACRARVPVQTLVIETASGYLSKGWPIWRSPSFPIVVRIGLGRRFAPTHDTAALTAQIESWFRAELATRAPLADAVEADAFEPRALGLPRV